MPEITIRQVEGQELLDIFYLLDNYAFHPTPPFPNREEWEARAKARTGPDYYALYEDDEAVAIAIYPRLSQNVRGKIFKMAGVAGVSSHPRTRRKGYIRQLLRDGFEVMKNEGRPLSCLYPFRESFYERLGYVTFPQARKALFNAANLKQLLKTDLGGEVEMHLIGDAYDTYRDYVLSLQPHMHGLAVFEDSQKESAQSNRSWVAVAKVAGEVVGILGYSIKGSEMMDYDFQAVRFYYHTSQGKYLLLDWIARHVDQAGNAEVWLPAYEQPNTWLSDMRPKLEPVFVSPMGRVLEVAGIGGMETGPGSFSAKISDPDCPWNNGIWKFVGDSGTLEVSPAQSADCNLAIQGLAALVYGVNDPADFAIRGWGDPSPELVAVMQAMFPPKLPYLHEYY